MFVAFSDGCLFASVPSDSRWAILLVAVGDIQLILIPTLTILADIMDVKKQRTISEKFYFLCMLAISFFLINTLIETFAQIPNTPKPSTEKYRLIFPTSYEDNLLFDSPPKDKKEEKARNKAREKNYSQIQGAKEVNFLVELNRAGSQSYRLLSSTNREIAMTVLEAKQYKYVRHDSAEYTRSANDGSKFEKWFSVYANQGFSLIDFAYSGSACSEDENQVGIGKVINCDYRYNFLLEKQQNVSTPQPFKVIKGNGWLTKNDVDTEQVYTSISENFLPAFIFSRTEFLFQNQSRIESDLSSKSRVLVASNSITQSGILGIPKLATLAQRVNFLANQGYRIALTHDNLALMYRNSDITSSVIYWWLDTKDQDLEYRLLHLQEKGAVYRLRSLRRGLEGSDLIFEQPTEPTPKQRDYKILKLELAETEHFAEKKVTIDLTAEAKETMKQINRLANEGYEVRDLFVDNYYRNGCSVLLERKIPKP